LTRRLAPGRIDPGVRCAPEDAAGLEAARDRLAAALAEHARLSVALADASGRPDEAAARARLRAVRGRVQRLDEWLDLLERPAHPPP
jgi:hypothetical protein